MPSLIYIARIKSLPEELAKSLRSAGCHVKSFKPGDITQDKCLLAITAEAVGATLQPEGDRAETGTTFAGTPAALDMNEQLGSQAAIWNSITKESQAERERVSPLASTEEPGLSPAEVRRPEVSRAKGRANGEIARVAPAQIIAVVASAEASRTPKKIRPTREQFYRVFRNPLSTVVALLLFSVVYRGVMRPSTKGVRIRHGANYAARSDSDSANSILNISASPGRTANRSTPPLILSSAEPLPQPVHRVQRHLSYDDSVAEDFTNHLALRTQSEATQQNPELKHPQSGSMRKRIVLDQE